MKFLSSIASSMVISSLIISNTQTLEQEKLSTRHHLPVEVDREVPGVASTNTQTQLSIPHRLPIDVFSVIADKMKFKDLLAFALTDKAAKGKVKNYFNYRRDLLKNIEYPILTKEWILTHDRALLEESSIGTTPIQRRNPDVTHPTVELNGQKWGVAGLNAQEFSEDPSTAEYTPTQKNSVSFNIDKIDKSTTGPRMTKTYLYECVNSEKKGSILLFLEEEYLDLN